MKEYIEMKAKNKKVGDIYINPISCDLWFLNKIYYSEEQKEKWTLNLIHDDWQEELEAVSGFIKVGNIYEMLNNEINLINERDMYKILYENEKEHSETLKKIDGYCKKIVGVSKNE